MYSVRGNGITLAFTSESLNLRGDNQARRADNDSIGRTVRSSVGNNKLINQITGTRSQSVRALYIYK